MRVKRKLKRRSNICLLIGSQYWKMPLLVLYQPGYAYLPVQKEVASKRIIAKPTAVQQKVVDLLVPVSQLKLTARGE
jgi:hypothetical protein